MTLLTTELVDTGEKRAKNGRRMIPAEAREALIAEYETSGLTQRAFALREGLSFCTFTTWLARQRKAQRKSKFTEVSVAQPKESGVLEIVLPNGVVLRGKEVEPLAALMERLGRC